MLAIDDANLQLEIATRIAGAEEVRQRIESLLTHTTIAQKSVIFHKKGRIKLAKSIFDKIQDRRRKLPERGYGLGDVGDVVGFRLITLYDDSLFDLFEELMRVIEQGQNIANPIFKRVPRDGRPPSLPDTFNDCCVFAQNDAKDNPYILCHARIKEKFELTNDTMVRLEIRKNGYSSIHVQLDGLLYRDRTTRSIPVEFQLRTALEDTWAEISHELEYKKRYDHIIERDAWKTSIDSASDQLFTFKKAIDEATRQATAIRKSYKKIDDAIAPMMRDRQFIVERPLSLTLIETRCSVPLLAEAADAADELHVLLNRLVLDRIAVESEGVPRRRSATTVLPPLKPKYELDPRLRLAERQIKELEEYFERDMPEADKLLTIKSLLALERKLLTMRVLICRIAQMRYERASKEDLGLEVGHLRRQLGVIKEFVKNRDSTFELIGAAAGTLAARYLDDIPQRQENAARAFDIALKDPTSTNSPEILRVAQTTLGLNALVHHLGLNSAKAAPLRRAAMKAKGAKRTKFIALTREGLRDALLILAKFYDPNVTYKLYFDNVVSVGNSILMAVVDLHDVGVDQKEIARHISSQQISNITEMMGRHDVENEYRGHRLHTLCGVYRVLKRREQWKRAARELREHFDAEKGKLDQELKAAYREELARRYAD